MCAANTPAEHADRIVILKSQRKMLLYSGDHVLRTYTIALGSNPVGRKTRRGDHRTPEGHYIIDGRNSGSHFHKALHVSYPSSQERELARNSGTDSGGDIFIHGLQNGLGWIGKGHRLVDWTDGCIAVTDQEMDEIWRLVPNGTPIEIKP